MFWDYSVKGLTIMPYQKQYLVRTNLSRGFEIKANGSPSQRIQIKLSFLELTRLRDLTVVIVREQHGFPDLVNRTTLLDQILFMLLSAFTHTIDTSPGSVTNHSYIQPKLLTLCYKTTHRHYKQNNRSVTHHKPKITQRLQTNQFKYDRWITQ